MNNDLGSWIVRAGFDGGLAFGNLGIRPVKELLGHWSWSVDATMTHGVTEVLVPIRPMNTKVIVEKHRIRDIW